MRKELQALEKFLDDYLTLCEKLHTNRQEKMLLDKNSPYNVLKTYLQFINNAESSEALKSLEVLDKIISPLLEPVLAEYEDDLSDKITANYFALKQSLLKAEKELKALEIIKKKSVWVGRLKSLFRKYNNNNLDVLRFYNANMWVDYQLTKEEFNLLKEVLE